MLRIETEPADKLRELRPIDTCRKRPPFLFAPQVRIEMQQVYRVWNAIVHRHFEDSRGERPMIG